MRPITPAFSFRRAAFTALLSLAFGCPGGGQPTPDGGVPPPSSDLDPAACTVVLEPSGPVVADGSTPVTVTVTLKDVSGRPLSQVGVSIALSGTGGQVNSPPNTDHNGVTTAHLGSTVAEIKTVTVTVNSTQPVTLPQAPSVNFIAGPATGIVFGTQPPATVKAGATIAPAVTLLTTDAHGNLATAPVITASVRLVFSSGGVASGGGAKASVDGVITFDALSVNRPQAGYALRAEVPSGPGAGGADESHRFDVVVGDPAAPTSTLVASPVNLVADGTSTTTLTFTLHDLGDNAVPGVPVALTVSGTGNALGAASGTTDLLGVFSTTLSSTVAEAKTVTADAGTVALDAQVTFIP